MTTYQVLSHVDQHVILEMEADNAGAVPTSVTGDPGMVGWANDLVKSGQSVYYIGAGCGSYNTLVRKDGLDEPPDPSAPRAKKMVPRGRPGAKNR